MRLLDVVGLVVLALLAAVLGRYLAKAADERLLARRLESAPWRRTEYVDAQGVTHVVLRRSVRDSSGAEILADHDREVAAIPPGSADFDDRLAAARLDADLSAGRTNYRRQ